MGCIDIKNTLFSNRYYFDKIEFTENHHTDNSKGSPKNYIAYLEKGTAKIKSDKKTLHLKAGNVFHIPLGLPYHSYWYGKEIVFYSFGYNELGIAEEKKYDLQIIECDDEIRKMLSSVKMNGGEVNCNGLVTFYSVMEKILPLMNEYDGGRDREITEKIKSEISKNTECTMGEIAKKCGISEPYLYSVFKKCEMMTPNEFRQIELIKKGEALLMTTDKKVEEIAGILNFSSASYFRKVMKKYTGKNPLQVRKVQIL